jgi:uncharacterized membrane protein YhaH (DUF805 family)
MDNTNKNPDKIIWPFKRKNYLLFGFAVLVIIVGYFIMYMGDVNSFQSVTLAPILLIVGYIVLIPLAILKN